ncbi:MAG: radical SAM family heme chaperone HemW [Cyanobacteria bacterium HKST-UBA04]|nr:radical SAM family heme chaperone HemW [Cyanobacteria bacterium HKST-UBA04]
MALPALPTPSTTASSAPTATAPTTTLGPAMAYIHCPFCLSQCIYCDFAVDTRHGHSALLDATVEALCQEMTHCLTHQPASPLPPLPPLSSVFLGGGTPSRFSARQLQRLLDTLTRHQPLAPDAEITMELNPERPASPLADYRAIGINRLSIGVQSMQPNELKRLSRLHGPDDVRQTVAEARASGFDNLALDVMVGLPDQTPASWQATLEALVALAPDHVSMYGLQVEPGTKLASLVDTGRFTLPDEDTAVSMYWQGIDFLEASGLVQYEISNLARPGFASRHNTGYWQNQPFWGFGPGAHSSAYQMRRANPKSLDTYLANPTQPETVHHISPVEDLENALIFGLRQRAGVNLDTLAQIHGPDVIDRLQPLIEGHLSTGALEQDGTQLRLGRAYIPVSNSILDTFIGLGPVIRP